jgi:hypothetical protein
MYGLQFMVYSMFCISFTWHANGKAWTLILPTFQLVKQGA